MQKNSDTTRVAQIGYPKSTFPKILGGSDLNVATMTEKSVIESIEPGLSLDDKHEAIKRICGLLKGPQTTRKVSLLEKMKAATTIKERDEIYSVASALFANGSMSTKAFLRIDKAYKPINVTIRPSHV